jgi:hypothetical protein
MTNQPQAGVTKRPQPTYDDEVALAATQPEDSKLRKELLACGVEIVDPSDYGHDYPYRIQIRLDDGITEFDGSTDHPADCSSLESTLRIWTLAQLQPDRTLAKSVIVQVQGGAPRTLGRHLWTKIPELGIELRCIPGTLQKKTSRRINVDAEKRCENCRLFDKAAGQEEYNAVTHEDAPFGGDRQMWKDIADREAGNRKIRRLEVEHVGFCMEHDAILDERMEACDDWIPENEEDPPRAAPGAPWEDTGNKPVISLPAQDEKPSDLAPSAGNKTETDTDAGEDRS